MDSLILYNQVESPLPLTIGPNTGTPTNPVAPTMGGGLFTVTDDAILYGVGTPRNLLPPGPYVYLWSSSLTGGSANVPIPNPMDGILSSFSSGAAGSDIFGNGVSGLGTATSDIVGNITTAPNNVGKLVLNNKATNSATQTLGVNGGNQFFAVIDEFNTVLGTLTCGFGTTKTTKFAAPITLKPGIQYALICIYGANSIPVTAGRVVTGNSLVTLGQGFNSFVDMSFYGNTVAKATVNFRQGTVKFISGTHPAGVNVGDFMLGVNTTGPTPQVLSIDSAGNAVIFPSAVGSWVSTNFNFSNPASILRDLMTNHGGWGFIAGSGRLGTNWAGDFYLDIRQVIKEPLPRPPAPTVVAAPSQFTVSIPQAFIPQDLQEYDIQYARSLDNASFGNWLDVGTFPAVNSQDGLNDLTTNPVGTYVHQVSDTTPLDALPFGTKLPYYVYRYRMRTSGRQSAWSGPTYAGQIQGDPVS